MTIDPPVTTATFTVSDLGPIRDLVRLAATTAALGRRGEDLVLATNEIVANAVLYGGGSGTIRIAGHHGGLTVEVSDHGPGLPGAASAARPAADVPGGRGLWLARELCTRVEFDSTPRGLTVRLVMDRP